MVAPGPVAGAIATNRSCKVKHPKYQYKLSRYGGLLVRLIIIDTALYPHQSVLQRDVHNLAQFPANYSTIVRVPPVL